jgi:hypothetical protein
MRDYVFGMTSFYTCKSSLPEQGLAPCLLGKLSFGGTSFGGLQWRRKKNPGVHFKPVSFLIVFGSDQKKQQKIQFSMKPKFFVQFSLEQ